MYNILPIYITKGSLDSLFRAAITAYPSGLLGGHHDTISRDSPLVSQVLLTDAPLDTLLFLPDLFQEMLDLGILVSDLLVLVLDLHLNGHDES